MIYAVIDTSSEEMPYKFNGKELDEETGLYYYGARYMQPMASIWYGVDQLTEEHPMVSSYVYTDGNPIKFVDPDGNKKLNWTVIKKENEFHPERDARYCSAYHRENFYDENVVNIWAHGSRNSYRKKSWGIEVATTSDGKKGYSYAYYIKSDVKRLREKIDRTDKGWAQRKQNIGHPIIVLHSCASSQFAEKISGNEEFKDVIIIAPDATLNSSIGKGEFVRTTISGEHYEKRRQGKWHVYMNGKPVIGKDGKPITYNANAQPGSKGFNYNLEGSSADKNK